MLTKSISDEVINGTAASDLFNATELGSLQNGDLVLDNSTTDNDILNATVNANNIAARIQNVETLNIQGEYVKTGLDLTNVSGTTDLNLSTKIAGGVATVTAANSLNAEAINAGTNIATLDITSLTSGTRDAVTVDAGAATTINLTGAAAGADVYDVTVADGAKVTLAAINSAGDSVTLNGAGDINLDSNQGPAAGAATMTQNLGLVINATDDLTVTSANPVGTLNLLAKEISLTGTGDIRIVSKDGADLAGKGAVGTPNYDGVKVTASNTGTSTVEIEVLDNAGVNDFSKVAVDTIEISGGTPKATAMDGITTIVLNENTSLNVAGELGAALTVHVDNGNSDTAFESGTAVLSISQAQTTGSIVTGVAANASNVARATVDTLIVSATADEATDYDADENGFNEIQAMEVSAVTLSANNYGNHDGDAATPNTWDAITDVMVVQGDENIEFNVINFKAHGQVVSAANLTGDMTITNIDTTGIGGDATKAITIVGGKGNDDINSTNTALLDIQAMYGDNKISIVDALNDSKVTTGAGNDRITSSDQVTVIKTGAGDDTVIAAGKDTITLGAGADKVELSQTASGVGSILVTDFVKGEDTVVLAGGTMAATKAINFSNVTVASGVYTIDGYELQLQNAGSNLSATDMRDSFQAENVTLADATTNILGSLSDSVIVAATESATITTGAGNDTVTIAAGAASNATIKDFTVGEDKIIATGTITADLGVNLKNVADVSGTYTIGDATLGQSFKLENGGSNIVTDNDLTEIVQLGTSTANFIVVATGADISVTGGKFNDYVELTSTVGGNVASYNFLLDGSVDTVELTAGDADTLANFNQLAGINTLVDAASKKIGLASDDAKVNDAKDQAVYVFSDSHKGASDTITTFEVDAKNGYTAETILDEVAAFINTRLGVQDGEKYVVVINDTSSDFYEYEVYGGAAVVEGAFTDNAYAYYVTGDTDGVQADDIQLIGTLVSTTTAVTTTDIA